MRTIIISDLHYSFVSWKELFNKMDKIDIILENLKNHKDEFGDILLKSEEIKTRLDAIFNYH